ncbi:MAG: hypothetical protein H0W82_09415 [Actinobacteria bacterium]|nr:hypothetical protein [Actinomycetota bacterium]
MEFHEALTAHGFRQNDEQRMGALQSRQYVATPNRFMTYSVHTYDDGTAIFSWEFALADFLADRGIQVGSDEALNQFLYPREDARGPQDAAWLGAAIEHVRQTLASLRFDDPEG